MKLKSDFDVSKFSIGPFTIDKKASQVTLTPGVYTIREPVTLTFDEAGDFNVIGGDMEYRPLAKDGAEPN